MNVTMGTGPAAFDHGDRFGGLLIGYVVLITVPVVYN